MRKPQPLCCTVFSVVKVASKNTSLGPLKYDLVNCTKQICNKFYNHNFDVFIATYTIISLFQIELYTGSPFP